jgi:DNA-binding GntR family transcriptional regulator
VEAISDLPMPNDMDADYSPQYIKLARILRAKIESGQYRPGDGLPSTDLAREYEVSPGVVCHALAVLAANRYVDYAGNFRSYSVTWQSGA